MRLSFHRRRSSCGPYKGAPGGRLFFTAARPWTTTAAWGGGPTSGGPPPGLRQRRPPPRLPARQQPWPPPRPPRRPPAATSPRGRSRHLAALRQAGVAERGVLRERPQLLHAAHLRLHPAPAGSARVARRQYLRICLCVFMRIFFGRKEPVLEAVKINLSLAEHEGGARRGEHARRPLQLQSEARQGGGGKSDGGRLFKMMF